MQVSHDEGLATRIGPAPCVVGREAGGEASAGESVGQPSSRERINWSADAVWIAEGETGLRVNASAGPAPRGLRPWHADEALCTGTGRSRTRPSRRLPAARIGKAMSRSR